MIEENDRDIGANCKKRAMTERQLTVVAEQEIKTKYRDRIDHHITCLQRLITGRKERKRDAIRSNVTIAASVGQLLVVIREREGRFRDCRADHQTRVVILYPNRPDGLIRRMKMIKTNATVNLSSVPTT